MVQLWMYPSSSLKLPSGSQVSEIIIKPALQLVSHLVLAGSLRYCQQNPSFLVIFPWYLPPWLKYSTSQTICSNFKASHHLFWWPIELCREASYCCVIHDNVPLVSVGKQQLEEKAHPKISIVVEHLQWSLIIWTWCATSIHINNFWLVVSTPLKNISRLGLLFPIYGQIKHVPNHQPDLDMLPRVLHKNMVMFCLFFPMISHLGCSSEFVQETRAVRPVQLPGVLYWVNGIPMSWIMIIPNTVGIL
jgi:hypothetical protein